MKTIKSAINETAHCMAQVSQTRIRYLPDQQVIRSP